MASSRKDKLDQIIRRHKLARTPLTEAEYLKILSFVRADISFLIELLRDEIKLRREIELELRRYKPPSPPPLPEISPVVQKALTDKAQRPYDVREQDFLRRAKGRIDELVEDVWREASSVQFLDEQSIIDSQDLKFEDPVEQATIWTPTDDLSKFPYEDDTDE